MFSLFTIILLTANDLFKCRSHLKWNRFNIVRKFNCARNLYTGCRCLIDYLSVGLSMNWSLVKVIVLFEGINTRINRPKYEYESFIFCFNIRQVRILFIIGYTILFFFSATSATVENPLQKYLSNEMRKRSHRVKRSYG